MLLRTRYRPIPSHGRARRHVSPDSNVTRLFPSCRVRGHECDGSHGTIGRSNAPRAGHARPRVGGSRWNCAVRRRWGDSNSRGASTPTSLAGRRTRPLCDISGCRIGPMSLPQGTGPGQTGRPARGVRARPRARAPPASRRPCRDRRFRTRWTVSPSTSYENVYLGARGRGRRALAAERGGFEPPVRQAYSGFQDRHIRPLCHLSTSAGPARGQAQTLPPRRASRRPSPASSSTRRRHPSPPVTTGRRPGSSHARGRSRTADHPRVAA